MTIPLPHSALLHLTGWPELDGEKLRVGRHVIRCLRPPTLPAGRVTVTAYPRTFPDGRLASLSAYPHKIKPANGPNGATFSVTGHLTRLDRHSGEIRVTVLPTSDLDPFSLTLHGTSEVLHRLDPSTTYATVRGRLLDIGRGFLLAESIEVAHAPMPERWRGWKPPRFRALKKDNP